MDIQRGEILKIHLNPTQGREPSGNARPCLVISQTKYNAVRQGIVIVMPITRSIRPDIKMMIPLPDRSKIHGSVIVEQVRTVDLNQRWWKTTQKVIPEEFVDHIVNTFQVLIR